MTGGVVQEKSHNRAELLFAFAVFQVVCRKFRLADVERHDTELSAMIMQRPGKYQKKREFGSNGYYGEKRGGCETPLCGFLPVYDQPRSFIASTTRSTATT